jgi:outer membrane protein
VQRSELKSLDAQRKISEDQISFAQGAYWPTLSLEGGYLRNQPSPMPVNTVSESLYGSAMLNFPFFEGGLRRAEVREAESKKKQADLSLEDLKKTVSIEVDAAYLSLKTAEGVLKSLEDQLTFAKDNYNAVSKQFEHGLATSIDMIDANTLLTTAERQLSDAQLAYAYSILVLERTTGTFLKTVTSRLTSADNKN